MRSRLALVLLLLAAALSGCVGADDDPAGPDADAAATPDTTGGSDGAGTYRPNVWLLDDVRPPGTSVSSGAEPSILVSKDGETLWIGDTSGLSISTDNGTTWRDGADPFLLSSDGWSLAEDDVGNLYFSTTTTVSVTIARSSDGGRTVDHTDQLVDFAPVADRPWLAARGDGEVVLFMYDYGRTFSETCVHSMDGGETWLDRGLLTAAPQGGGAVFDDDGNFYVGDDTGRLWRFAGTCLTDGGFKQMFPKGLGANNMNKIDHEDGAFYMAASGPGNKEVLLSGLRSWNGVPKVIPVSPPALQSNAFATVSIHDDQLAVAWYGSETPGDPSVSSYAGAFNVFVAIVDDFWSDTPTIRHVRLTDEPNHVGDICMGGIGCSQDAEADRDLLDYFMVDHDPWGGVHVAYGHDGTGTGRNVRYAHVPPAPAPTTEDENPGTPGDLPPVVAFEVLEHENRVKVDASASHDPEGGTLAFVWDWGDGSPVDTGPTAFHEYDGYGARAINLTVTDPAGNVAWHVERLVVGDDAPYAAPRADFVFSPLQPRVGEAVSFSDRSTDADDDIVLRSWDFDGEAATGADPTFTFDTPGTHAVTLTVTDDWHMEDRVTQFVRVQEAPPADPDTPTAQKDTPGVAPGLLAAALASLALARRRLN